MVRRLEVRGDSGQLYLEPWTSGWYADFHAPFLFREVSGDFVVETVAASRVLNPDKLRRRLQASAPDAPGSPAS